MGGIRKRGSPTLKELPRDSHGGNAVDLNCLNHCHSTFTSFPPRRESSFFKIFRVPAFMGMRRTKSTRILKSATLSMQGGQGIILPTGLNPKKQTSMPSWGSAVPGEGREGVAEVPYRPSRPSSVTAGRLEPFTDFFQAGSFENLLAQLVLLIGIQPAQKGLQLSRTRMEPFGE